MSANGTVQITELFIYPVKSCRGISVREAKIGQRGFLHDREFLVVDETGTFITQRNATELALVQIALVDGAIELNAPGAGNLRVSLGKNERAHSDAARPVTIFNDQVMADDAGEDAAEWFSAALHRRCRLVRIGESYSRKVPLENIAVQNRPMESPEIPFTDAFPTLLVSEESLADLNTRLSSPLPMERFRPTIIVRGCAPYDENTWDIVRSDNIVFRAATPCRRCVITTIDQRTGKHDGAEPLRTLATYRRTPDGNGVIFGEYMIHSGSGVLRVGEKLEVERTGQDA